MPFSLVTEPWIPCLFLDDPVPRELGLRDVLARSHQIREVVGVSPLAAMSLHRLMLAVAHRVFGPTSASGWRSLRDRGQFDPQALDRYFDAWAPRFELFGGDRPFFQDPTLDVTYAGPVTKLFHERASGNNALLFDHAIDEAPDAVPAGVAAQQLLVHQNLALGGLVSFERGADPKIHKSAKAGLLVNFAVFLVQGDNLFETLLLNMHAYAPEQEQPFAVATGGEEADDRPAWERDAPPRVTTRPLDGYLDLLTWQSRRIRLFPSQDPGGRPIVRQVAIMKGESLPDDYTLHGKDPAVAFSKTASAKETDPWLPLGFREGRALWRDSLALVQTTGTTHQQPKILTWLSSLDRQSEDLELLVIGLASDRAKPEFWRIERFRLPTQYLTEGSVLLEYLKSGLRLAELGAKLLTGGSVEVEVAGKSGMVSSPMRILGRELIGDGGDLRAFARSLGGIDLYWGLLDVPFQRLLHGLPGSVAADGDAYPAPLQAWARTVRTAVREAFASATTGLQGSALAFRALSKAEASLDGHLHRIVSPYFTRSQELPA